MLRQGEVYFASAGELNDASECRPRLILKGSEELWQRLAQFILENACFGSDYFQFDKKDEIRQILDLSVTIGRLLKKQAKNKDFGIESLGSAFRNALKSCGSENLSPFLLRMTEHLTSNFIQEGLPQILLDEKYIASFALNATNPDDVGSLCRCGTWICEGVRNRRRQGQSSFRHKYPSWDKASKNGQRRHRCYRDWYL